MTTRIIAIIWTLFAATGMNWAVRNVVLALGDAKEQQEHGLNGAREVITKGNLRRETARVVVHGLFIIVGVLVIMEVRGNWLTWFSRAAFLIAAGLLALSSMMDSRDRDEIKVAIRDREGKL